jgi:hypothetical protein
MDELLDVCPEKLSVSRVGGRPTRKPNGMGAVTESYVQGGNGLYGA